MPNICNPQTFYKMEEDAMKNLPRRLPPHIMNALLGRKSSVQTWKLRSGESLSVREKLLEFLDDQSAKHELLFFLRREKVPRELADRLLEIFDIPTKIPAGAMTVLGLSLESDSPLDHPVFWDTPGCKNNNWYWRRTDRPIVAVPLKNGGWKRGLATY